MKKKMDNVKKEMDEIRKKLNILQKEPEKNQKEIEELTKQMLSKTTESMTASFSTMKYTLPVLTIILALAGIGYSEVPIIIPKPLAIPWFGESLLSIKWYTQTNWFGWYMLISLITSLILNIVVKRLIKNA